MVLSIPQQCHLLPLLALPCLFVYHYCMRDGRFPGKSLWKPTEWYGVRELRLALSAVTRLTTSKGLSRYLRHRTWARRRCSLHCQTRLGLGDLSQCAEANCVLYSHLQRRRRLNLLVLASPIYMYDSERSIPSPTTMESSPSCTSSTHH